MRLNRAGVVGLRCAATTAGAFACLLVYVSAPLAGIISLQPGPSIHGLDAVPFDLASVSGGQAGLLR